jgi:hypothetical protein
VAALVHPVGAALGLLWAAGTLYVRAARRLVVVGDA